MARKLKQSEMTKRGCIYCLNQKKVGGEYISGAYYAGRHICKFDKCPYHELDKHDTYDDYLESEDCQLDFKDLPKYIENL